MKDLINSRVKHRESFCPFAPVVLVERMSEFFEIDQPNWGVDPELLARNENLPPKIAS
jgi:hypothetical protein